MVYLETRVKSKIRNRNLQDFIRNNLEQVAEKYSVPIEKICPSHINFDSLLIGTIHQLLPPNFKGYAEEIRNEIVAYLFGKSPSLFDSYDPTKGTAFSSFFFTAVRQKTILLVSRMMKDKSCYGIVPTVILGKRKSKEEKNANFCSTNVEIDGVIKSREIESADPGPLDLLLIKENLEIFGKAVKIKYPPGTAKRIVFDMLVSGKNEKEIANYVGLTYARIKQIQKEFRKLYDLVS